MKASQAARAAGVSVKALRYYETLNLIAPPRLPNGYREYSELDVELSRQIAALLRLGLTVQASRPFLNCLRLGYQDGDECLESLLAYRDEIRRLDALLLELTARRDELRVRLYAAAQRGFPLPELGGRQMTVPTYGLPENLPVPEDDGQAAHLPGLDLPELTLPAHDNSAVNLQQISQERWVLFIYPTTGVPGQDMPDGWDSIPGARGCTPEACGFRDNLSALRDAGARAIYGLSHQGSAYQAELAGRLHLPYLLLCDAQMQLGAALGLPTFQIGEVRYYKRLTLILRGKRIEHVFYPIFPPTEHAAQVLAWLMSHA